MGMVELMRTKVEFAASESRRSGGGSCLKPHYVNQPCPLASQLSGTISCSLSNSRLPDPPPHSPQPLTPQHPQLHALPIHRRSQSQPDRKRPILERKQQVRRDRHVSSNSRPFDGTAQRASEFELDGAWIDGLENMRWGSSVQRRDKGGRVRG